MSDKIFKNRIPDSELSNEFKRDGETLHGGDLNRIVTVTKGGINYNAKLFESYLYGDDFKPFYHGNELDWQTNQDYITWGTVYWVRSVLNSVNGLPYVYVTKMQYNETSESWEEKEIIKIIDTESLNEALEDYLHKDGGKMRGNIDMDGYDITDVDNIRAHNVRADEMNVERAVGGLTVEDFLDVEGSASSDKAITKEIVLLSNVGQETASIKLDENGNIDFNGKKVVNIELPEIDAKLDGKLDKLTGRGETGLRVYAAFNGGVESYLDVDTNPSAFTLARRGGNGEVWTGDATKKHDAVPLGQLNTMLEDKVDKVAGKQLSDENFTADEKSKLASLESSKFVGQFVSLQALNTAHPTAPIGSYAFVDGGVGEDAVKYIWDSSDSKWVYMAPTSAEITPALVKQLYEENIDTNAYTDAEKSKVSEVDNKVNKLTGTSTRHRVYTKLANGNQSYIETDRVATGGTLVERETDGEISTGIATLDRHAVNLGQADVRYVGVTGNQNIWDKKRFIKSVETGGNVELYRDGVHQASLSTEDKKLTIVGGNKSGEIAVMSDIPNIDELSAYISSKNLASPDLKGKEYLGDGIYKLHEQNGGTLTYNVYDGEYRVFGNITGAFTYFFGYDRPYADNNYIQIWKTKQVIWENNGAIVAFGGNPSDMVTVTKNSDYAGKFSTPATSMIIRLYQVSGEIDVSFKLQLEKGDTATPYAVPAGNIPYLPEVKSELNGKLDKVASTSTFHQVYVKSSSGLQDMMDLADIPHPLTLARRGLNGELAVGNAINANDAVALGQLNWTLIATNTSETTSTISLPAGTREILITATDGSNSIILPNVQYAMGQSALVIGNDVYEKASWNITTVNTLKKSWGSGADVSSTTYLIYGR